MYMYVDVIITLNNLINIVSICHPSAHFSTLILAVFELCVCTLCAWPVLSVIVLFVFTGPAFTVKLNPEENLTFLGSGVSTAANKSRNKWLKELRHGWRILKKIGQLIFELIFREGPEGVKWELGFVYFFIGKMGFGASILLLGMGSTSSPGPSPLSRWRVGAKKTLTKSRSRASKNIGDFDCFKMAIG